MEHQNKISVILPASGSGERFGSDTPKQFCKLIDVPVILHTISLFHRCAWISEIIVSVSSSFLQYTQDMVCTHGFNKVSVIEGCPSRHRSIYAGVKHLKGSSPDVVIIHDSVRVFAEESLIKEVAQAALEHGASGVVRPLVSTVVSVESEGFLEESLDRSMFRASEMPQAFLYSVINTAYEKATDFDFDYGTECLLLAKKYTGTKAKLIEGPDYLWKVTYRKDLFSAEELLKEQLLKVLVHGDLGSDLKNALVTKCADRRLNIQMSCDTEKVHHHPCNSHVYVYKQFDKDRMVDNTASVCSDQPSVACLKLPVTVLHVFLVPEVASEAKLECLSVCRQLEKNHEKALVFAVLCEGCTDYNRLSEMVVDILWNRTKSMSGQTFFIS